ncbi:MAG: CdaR family protein [Terriglobales bacterium]
MADSIRTRLMHNLGLKIVSLGFAVVLWLSVARDPQAVVAVEVPIEFNNIPQNLEISSEDIPRIQIRLRGPERVIRRLQPPDVYAELDLDAQRAGDHTFDITSRQIHHPGTLEVVQVVPSQVRVSFDTRATRQVGVRPRVVGNFIQGYGIARIVANPATVTISGPRKHVEAVDSAITDPIDVSGAMDRITAERHAYVPDPLIQVTNPEPVQVTVYVEKDATGSGKN